MRIKVFSLSLSLSTVNFSSYLGMLVVGFKEMGSLLKKLEARKGRGVQIARGVIARFAILRGNFVNQRAQLTTTILCVLSGERGGTQGFQHLSCEVVGLFFFCQGFWDRVGLASQKGGRFSFAFFFSYLLCGLICILGTLLRHFASASNIFSLFTYKKIEIGNLYLISIRIL